MGRLSRLLLVFLGVLTPFYLVLVSGETYSVKIRTDQYVNVVSKNFLSFTVDPKYLFSSSDKYDSQERVCMASSLTPAYLRIAGPSTAHMTFKNTTITIDNNIEDRPPRKLFEQWKSFAMWAKATGFEIVFALNNGEKMKSGMWDPKSTLDILSVAAKAGIDDVFWQLGYECSNQTIDDYLNDLETLRVVVESFPSPPPGWRVASGDVTGCLRSDSKSDFKDYVTLALDMTDAVLLNGNSSSHELERLSASDRMKLLKLLHTSSTPLWLTERPQPQSELERAADWMSSLGYSARNGFAVHYRELGEGELYQPTLSFYMALLYKNLVGERVLSVDIDSSEALLFAHCTSLRHQPVPGAVTLYGVNMDDEPARLSLRLSKREEGGDILQFILSQDDDGNIIVNGRVMSQEGDIRPVVKRVRPYKTLLINLPAKSFGFWVLANTKTEACRDFKESEGKLVEALSVEVEAIDDAVKGTKTKKIRRKRSLSSDDRNDLYVVDITHFDENNDLKSENKEWNDKIDDLNSYLKDINRFLRQKSTSRTKRQTSEENRTTYKLRRQLFKTRKDLKMTEEERRPILNLIEHLLQLTRRNGTKLNNRIRHSFKLHRSKVGNKHTIVKEDNPESNSNKKLLRSRRSIIDDNYKSRHDKQEDLDTENEIGVEDQENRKLWKVLHSIQSQLKRMSEDNSEKSQELEKDGEIEPKSDSTKMSDDNANIDVNDKSNHSLFKTTFDKLFSAIAELNLNLSRFWEAFTFFD
ncbi:hypothetical protein ABMA28_009975 [Loxostege sticticalis]|uniref:Heparanase n=1 Tax=Loxostege sticticalis TaxID=481309 RepID=A0ABD0SCN3_LOXSC